MPVDDGIALPRPRTLVIGLDGVTFDLLEPWAQAGHLPNLARLISQAARGPLHSTIPAHSGPAWATFATGLLPGRHGVYHFAGATRDASYFKSVSSDSIRGRFFWDLAAEQGLTAGVINVPLTYPPRPIQDYMIAGLFAPDAPSAFGSPALYSEVTAACGEYIVSAPVLQNRQAFLDALLQGMRNGLAVGQYLMQHHPTDLFIIVFRMIDSVMHRYWADMDPQHPLHRELGASVIPDGILQGYRLLDEAVGRLWAQAGPQTTLVVMSDHGFRAEDRCFAFNKWLRERGLLKLKRRRAMLIGLAHQGSERLKLEMVLKRVGLQFLKAVGVEGRYEGWLYQTVDWPQTRVVYGPTQGLNINLKGRDFAGTVEPEDYEGLRGWLIAEMGSIRDPATGLPIFRRVCRREDVYSGEALDLAPDVVVEMAEYTTNGRHWGYGVAPIFSEWRLFPPPSRRLTGEHSPQGIFLAAGPHIRAGHYPGLHIADVAPTVLYSLGAAVPRGMDGRPRAEIFEQAHLAAHPIRYTDQELSVRDSGDPLSPDYDHVVTERLRELGYIE